MANAARPQEISFLRVHELFLLTAQSSQERVAVCLLHWTLSACKKKKLFERHCPHWTY